MRTSTLRRGIIVVLLSASAAIATALGTAGSADAARTAAAGYTDPVAGHPFGIYEGQSDALWGTYTHAHGPTRSLLATVALTPRTRWYSPYLTTSAIGPRIRADIAQEQHGDPNVEVWMALFRLWPHKEAAKGQPLSSADLAAYKAWMRNAAAAIGSARTAVVLEPDLPVALDGWRPAVRLGLVRYAARLLGQLPNTTVYLDAGAADWLSVPAATALLRSAGVQYVHGFALGITHHNSVAAEVRYGGAVVAALARAGVESEHFVVDTSDNGHPYTNAQFKAAHPGVSPEDVVACTAHVTRACVSVGIPPTTDVTDPRWALPAALHPILSNDVDAFMWLRLSWMNRNDSTFSLPYVLNIVRSSPYR